MPQPAPPRTPAASDGAGAEARSPGIAERAYRELRRRIVTLQLPPGAALREEELMRDLEIGRTPLREAVKRLELENLIEIRPRQGTSVTDVDAADIVHISEVRAELEGYAAELAARRMDASSEAVARALRAELEELNGRQEQELLMQIDERIHHFTWEAARNPYLLATLERYFALSLRIWYLVLDRVPALGGAVSEQIELLDALIGGDATRARSLMREHILAFQREILAAFSRP